MNQLASLRGTIFIAGIALFGISVMCNFLLYSSFSDDLLYQSTYAGMGIAFDVTKLCMAFSIGLCFYALEAYIFATIAGVFWLVLTAISIISAFGFMSVVNNQMENHALVSSAIFKSAENALDTSQARMDDLSKFADESTFLASQKNVMVLTQAKQDFMQSTATNSVGSAAGSVASRVGACAGSGYYVRKYCPQIDDFQKQIDAENVIIQGHQAYLGAMAAKNNRLDAMLGMDVSNSNVSSHLHPMFIGLATLLGKSADHVKYVFLIISSILCELLGSFSLVLYSRLNSLVGLKRETRTHPERAASSQNSPSSPVNTRTHPERADEDGLEMLDEVNDAIDNGKLTNLSFKSLKEFGDEQKQPMNQSTIRKIRDELVRNGRAVKDSTRKLVIVK